MNRLINDVKAGKVKNVLVYKIDRLTRSVTDLIKLIKLFEDNNCGFNSHTEKIDTTNAVGRMFVKMLGIFAEFERENLAERVAFGYEQKTREGHYTNTNGVYGYNYILGKGLEVNETEKIIVNDIYESYLKGDSMLSICKTLNNNQTPTKRGGKWSQSTIRSILTNPLYIGTVRYAVKSKNKLKKFETAGKDIEPIISEELWNNVRSIMKKRQQFKKKKYSSDDTYYFPSLRCDICGSRYNARQQVQNNKKYITYACNGHRNGTCNAPGFSHNKMEQSFLNYIKTIPKFEANEKIIKEIDPIDNSCDKEIIKKELKRVENKKKETRDLFVNDLIPVEEYQQLLSNLNNKKELLLNELKTSEEPKPKELTYDDIKNIVNNLNLNWQYLTNKERKNFLERFVKTIKVKKELNEVLITEMKF